TKCERLAGHTRPRRQKQGSNAVDDTATLTYGSVHCWRPGVGGTLAQFSKERWPADGPVRELLTYLEAIHRTAGQPSLSELGRAVALAPSTLSAFFTGRRLINRGNLELVVEYLGGNVPYAESLRRRAAPAWADLRTDPGRSVEDLPPLDPPDTGERVDVLCF